MEPNNQENLLRQGQQVQGGTVQFDQMTGKRLSEGQLSNPVGATFDINTGKKIPTSLLKEDVRPLTIPTPVPDTSATGLSSYVDSVATPAPQAPQTPQAPSRKRLTELTQKLGQESALLNKQYETEGVFTEQDTVNTIRDEITAETNATNNRIERLRNESKGMTQEAIAGEISRIERDSASKKADLAIALSLAERRFDRVKGIADRKVEIELAPLRAELELEKTFYEENKDLFTEQERRAFEIKQLETKQLYDTQKQTKDTISDIAVTIAGNGAPANVVSAVLNSKDQESAILAAGTYFKKPETGYDSKRADDERALLSQFNGQQIVKDYNTVVSNKLLIDNIISQGVGGPADLALVFSFMKGLDPNSVVREAEYENAAKSGNIFAGKWAKFNGYFKEKGGILPDSVKQEFANLVNLSVQAKQRQYNTVKSEYERIADSQGLRKENVTLNLENSLEDSALNTEPVISNNVDLTKFQGPKPQTAEDFFTELNKYQLPDFSSFFK